MSAERRYNELAAKVRQLAQQRDGLSEPQERDQLTAEALANMLPELTPQEDIKSARAYRWVDLGSPPVVTVMRSADKALDAAFMWVVVTRGDGVHAAECSLLEGVPVEPCWDAVFSTVAQARSVCEGRANRR